MWPRSWLGNEVCSLDGRGAAVCGTGAAVAQSAYQSPINEPHPAAAAAASPAITPNGSVVEDVIARVNDQIISRSDLERAQQQLAQELQQAGATPARGCSAAEEHAARHDRSAAAALAGQGAGHQRRC